ncbi:hypothetical protein OOZ15_12000 [Galbibacter sp. EGI 63066]|uniref:hypothetical protein n=1 Tax=Galbibacter sp. EGI 63066 TaxID=2993559 RepID=UPI0022497F51|nr:hypothetical protein [Galbibacter sp. EGI 63066]MCX2680667.1 hypothetical protein [Galbibacter sp. EGI 63066]
MRIKRVCIYPKDIQRITGKSIRSSRNLYKNIREYFEKEPHQFVSIQEFAIYSGIELEIVKEYITG